MTTHNQNLIHLEPWGPGDLELLKKLLGDPAMMEHLGGPESDEQLVRRQAKYERLTENGEGHMFKILYQEAGEAVGSIGFWPSEFQDEKIYEIGWSVLPGFQGKGIAQAATAQAIQLARTEGTYRFLHAFPSVQNLPSNALCRKLNFTLLGECEIEYPKGHFMQCNNWRLDLS